MSPVRARPAFLFLSALCLALGVLWPGRAEPPEYSVALDGWEETEDGWTVFRLSVCRDGRFLQTLEERTDSLLQYDGMEARAARGELFSLEDLNFDGYDDVKVLYENFRNGAYDAFLYDPETERFYEEPTFIQITAPAVQAPYVFSMGASGAAYTYFYRYEYTRDKGYTLSAELAVLSGYDVCEVGFVETLYEDGAALPLRWWADGGELDPLWTEASLAVDPAHKWDIRARNFWDPEYAPPACSQAEAAARLAYSGVLYGDTSLFADPAAGETWRWCWERGDLEYTLLDLDGEGTNELLVQWREDPGGLNAVFRWDGGKIVCWQLDTVETTCRDYPLRDGSMVRQYDYGGASTYTRFRYCADGTEETQGELYARYHPWNENDRRPCPFYSVDGREVDEAAFDAALAETVTGQCLDRAAWRPLP